MPKATEAETKNGVSYKNKNVNFLFLFTSYFLICTSDLIWKDDDIFPSITFIFPPILLKVEITSVGCYGVRSFAKKSTKEGTIALILQ